MLNTKNFAAKVLNGIDQGTRQDVDDAEWAARAEADYDEYLDDLAREYPYDEYTPYEAEEAARAAWDADRYHHWDSLGR